MNQQTFFDMPLGELKQAWDQRSRLVDAGELAKLRGMSVAAENRPEAVAAGKVSFLLMLLNSKAGTGTIDDSDADLSAKFGDGGKWRGTVCRSLAMAGIIRSVGVVKSDRPSRHRGYVTRWQLIKPDKARREIRRLSAWLTAEKENPKTAATVPGKCESKSTTPEKKESSDATV